MPAPWSLCILNQDGEILVHKNLPAGPEPFLKAVAPYRADLVGCVEGIFTWYWLADLCAREGIPFVLGHALSLKTIHGGTATHDTIGAQKLAVLRRGGMLPQADVDPAAMRATRALLRRRRPLTRTRAELLAHVRHTNSQDNRPELGKKLAYQANRDGVAERFPNPAGQKRGDVDLALIDSDDQRLSDVALPLGQPATQHNAPPLDRLQSVPGLGKSWSVVLRYEMQDSPRFPRGQEVGAEGRLVACAKDSAGNRSGTSGAKIGTAALPGAFSEAAVLGLRHQPAGQQYRARLETPHGPGKALPV